MTSNNRIQQHVQGGEDWGGNHADLAVWEDDVEAVRAMLQKMRPQDVDRAAAAFNRVANRMRTSVELLYNQASKMSEAWGGEAAKGAMQTMQRAYDQANEIHNKSSETSSAMSRHAGMMRSYQANPPEKAGGGGIMGGIVHAASYVSPAVAAGSAAASNDNADEFMGKLQNDTASSNQNFPPGIRSDVLNVEGYDPNQPKGGGGGGGTGGGGLPGGGSVPGGGGGGGVGGGHLPGGGAGGVGGGHLPGGGGVGGGGVGGGDLPGGGAGGVGGGDLPGGGTDLASAGGGGLPGGVGGGGLPGGGVGAGGIGTGPMGGGSGAGRGAGAGGAGAGKGAAGRGGMGAPMGGGHGGGEGEEERERSTWLTEDDDVWGGDGDAAPPVIG